MISRVLVPSWFYCFCNNCCIEELPSVSPESGWNPPLRQMGSTEEKSVMGKRGRQKETAINKQASVSTGLCSCFCLLVFLLVPEGAGAHRAGAGRGLTQERTKPKSRIQNGFRLLWVSAPWFCVIICAHVWLTNSRAGPQKRTLIWSFLLIRTRMLFQAQYLSYLQR